jgi:transcriptional regulator, XRE family
MKKIAFNQNKNVIYKQLRLIRKRMGVSQKDLAAKLQLLNVNIDQQMISKIENNKRIVTDYEFACLCKVLNVDEKEMLQDCYENLIK